jgi:purine-binding chemotaxis protein CheW
MTAPEAAKRTALVFRVGAKVLAANAADVAAVARRPALTRVPHAPAALAGLGALKGRATPVIELSALIGGGGDGAQLLVLRGEYPVAVAVDQIDGIRERNDDAAEWLDLRETVAHVFENGAVRQPNALPAASATEARLDAGERELSFVQFMLAGQRFAFPIAEMHAVLRNPAELVAVPEADPVVLGLTTYGEAVLPVVELADLLGLPRSADSAQGRLFVVEVGGAAVGLRVEKALGALRIKARAVSPAPLVLNRGAGEARVTAIARTPSGLTAILAVARLFDEPTMQRLNALAGSAPARGAPKAAVGGDEAIVVFRLGEERYGLHAAAVEAVGRPPADLVAPPNAPPFLAGMMSHRGEAIPVIDARARLGAEPAFPRSVGLQADDGAIPRVGSPAAKRSAWTPTLRRLTGAVIFVRRGAIAAGLWVDAVERVVHLPRSSLDRAPSLAGDAGELFASVSATELEGRPLLIVEADALLSLAKRDLSTWGAGRRPKRRT